MTASLFSGYDSALQRPFPGCVTDPGDDEEMERRRESLSRSFFRLREFLRLYPSDGTR